MAGKACVSLEVLVMGPIENNVYIVSDDATTFVVDPTCDATRIMKALDGRKLSAIVLTHAHWDHVGAAKELRDLTNARVIASEKDAPFIDGTRNLGSSHRGFDPCPVDERVSEGDMLEIGAMKWRVIETPGHTPGSMCLFLDPQYGSDRDGAPVLISGDTLFAGTHGRTDFEGSDPAAMRESLKKLAELPPETLVLPGHNNLTLIAHELSWLKRGGF